MIRVTVELLRRGSEKDRETLGVAEIVNVGGTPQKGDYAVRLMGKGGRAWKTGTVEGFLRRRLGGWDLLFRALGGVIAGRNPRVPFPKAWAEKPLDGGLPLAEVEENDPQAGGPEDPRKKELIEVLTTWAKCDPRDRKLTIAAMRGALLPGPFPKAVSAAIRALEVLGEAAS